MTLKEILDSLGMQNKRNKNESWYSNYGFVCTFGSPTRHMVSEYIKKCLAENNRLTLDIVHEILNGDTGDFWYYDGRGYIRPQRGEFDYIEINESGEVCVWCEVFGYRAYLKDYLVCWFTDREYELLNPFLEVLRQ